MPVFEKREMSIGVGGGDDKNNDDDENLCL